ncbi:MAG: 3-isopropylmalate dehydratase small subunit [Planctomycetota bacterium]|jgi:3-isopropylmalate/(R)-2-methylmalate dehydratase small subunit|nr:3-isopropylmalate dehydratase small subunit [Planctomycetota bacterium]
MNKTSLRGPAWVYGDNIDTDVIIPARYLTMSEPADLAKHCMEDIDKTFVKEVRKGDIVAGGANFGCGSSREHAPLAFIGSGVGAIVAVSFARIFFRNAVNVGLPILECPEIAGKIKKGDVVSIDTATGVIVNETSGEKFQARPFPEFLSELIDAGGLVEYARRRLR